MSIELRLSSPRTVYSFFYIYLKNIYRPFVSYKEPAYLHTSILVLSHIYSSKHPWEVDSIAITEDVS